MGKRGVAGIGAGESAPDPHLPVIAPARAPQHPATVSGRLVAHNGLPVFKTAAELYRALPEIDLVAICTPPGVRHAYVREALDAGKDVLMEKPPTPTISELDDLVAYAKKKKRVLFQTWHSRYNEAVDATRKIVKRDGVKSVRIDWRESVRKWHPGQDWVWQPGGFGVCDPGINALSIFTKVLPFPVFVDSASLRFPSNRQTPVDVEIKFKSSEPNQPEMSAGFNWLEESGEIWTIRIVTGRGDELKLENGGRKLVVNGATTIENPDNEYEQIYAHFAKLLKKRKSDVSDAPLRLVADAFLLGARENVDEFHW